MTIEPRCGFCAHSFVSVTGPRLIVLLHCGRESGHVREIAPRVQGWWKCEHFEREPGAEGDGAAA